MSDESSSYNSSISINEQLSDNKEDNQEIENYDDNGRLDDMEMEDVRKNNLRSVQQT